MSEERTYLLSFMRPDGEFAGACIVDVDEDDARAGRCVEHQYATPLTTQEWDLAAIRAAHEMACNPARASSTGVRRLDGTAPKLPRNRLLLAPELIKAGASISLTSSGWVAVL